jgi:Tfp pilus assembly protein PilP
MRTVKFSRTLWALALAAGFSAGTFAQEHPNISPNSIRDQLNQGGSAAPASQPAPKSQPIQNTAKPPAPPKPASPAPAPKAAPAQNAAKAPAPAKPATPAAKAASAPAKPAPTQKAPAKPETGKAAPAAPSKQNAAAAKPAGAPAEKPAAQAAAVVRRDPFETLLSKASAGNSQAENLPPGKAGLVVGSLRINGIINGKGGMIAIVTNPQQRVYFLREGDKLYDGSVQKITLEAISFNEIGKDAFGKPLERQVTKRLYPSPGEQQ